MTGDDGELFGYHDDHLEFFQSVSNTLQGFMSFEDHCLNYGPSDVPWWQQNAEFASCREEVEFDAEESPSQRKLMLTQSSLSSSLLEEEEEVVVEIEEMSQQELVADMDKFKHHEKKPKKRGEKRQREPSFAFITKSEVDHLEDGYRSYYRCTTQKCQFELDASYMTGPWAQFSSSNNSSPLPIFSKSPRGGAMSPVGNNHVVGLAYVLSLILSTYAKIAPIGKDQKKGGHSTLAIYVTKHVAFGNIGI
ncbi:hypothetical protein ZIOFF_006924 [Zingiber officinale]|uniref:Uncharacterized protein n=1 Tax=Zingiber officinale TaxID=94328 RepID=A0A8J5HSY1_ZINOF|nr:hypothetical protein ZIOFF_006924 [Zingiber officinale]